MKTNSNRLLIKYFGLPLEFASFSRVCEALDFDEISLFSLVDADKLRICVRLDNELTSKGLKIAAEYIGHSLDGVHGPKLQEYLRPIPNYEGTSYGLIMDTDGGRDLSLNGYYAIDRKNVCNVFSAKSKSTEVNCFEHPKIEELQFELRRPRKVDFSELLILKDELIRLVNTLEYGTELDYWFEIPEQYHLQPECTHLTSNSPQKKPHGNRVRFQQQRDEIVSFAFYLKDEFPEQCQKMSQWLDTIDEKALLKWPETGKPPHSRDAIRKLLSQEVKAKNGGY